jgi:hypothetical protein
VVANLNLDCILLHMRPVKGGLMAMQTEGTHLSVRWQALAGANATPRLGDVVFDGDSLPLM